MTSSEKILSGIAEDAQNRAAEIISDAEKKAEEAVKTGQMTDVLSVELLIVQYSA